MSEALASLEAQNLSKRYGSFLALDDLNLKIEGSKSVGFLGPNGAGKTTTLKIFCDMIRPSGGSAYINGINVSIDKKSALSFCGVLVETPEIYASLTVREALSMFAELKGIDRRELNREVEGVAALVKMSDSLSKKFGKLSRGMKQRINLAAAMLGDPEILLLDEPTTGLDPRGMAEMRSILKDLKRHKRLVFMSSHLLNEVTEVCDEVAMINKGKLLVYDTIQGATRRFTSGRSSYEAAFANPIDLVSLRRLLSGLNSQFELERIDSQTVMLTFSNESDPRQRIISILAAANTGLVSFRSSATALEDTYLNLVKDSA